MYQIFFSYHGDTFDDNPKIAALPTFKRILRLNSFVVKRVKNRRGEVQGIKLSTTNVREIFRKGGKENEYDDWFLSSLNLRSEGYDLLFSVVRRQDVSDENSNNSSNNIDPGDGRDNNSYSREDNVDAEVSPNLVNTEVQNLRTKLFEVKKDKANLIKDHKKIERQLKSTIQELEDKNKNLWDSQYCEMFKQVEKQREYDAKEKESRKLFDRIASLERELQVKVDSLELAEMQLSRRNQANTAEFGTYVFVSPQRGVLASEFGTCQFFSPDHVSLASPKEGLLCSEEVCVEELSPIAPPMNE